MSNTNRRVFNIITKVLRYVGIWSLHSTVPTVFRIFHSVFRLCTFIIYVLLLIGSGVDGIDNYKDLTKVTENLCLFIGSGTTIVKVLIFCIRQNTILKHVEDVTHSIDVLQHSSDSQVLNVIKITLRQDTKQFYSLSVVLTIVSLIRILAGRKRENGLPLPVYHPFDTSKSPIHQIMYILHSYCIVYNLIAILMGDLLIVSCIKWLTVQLKIIASNYQNCDSNLVERSGFNSTSLGATILNNKKNIHTDIDDIEIKTFVPLEQVHRDHNNNDDINDCFYERFKICIKQHQKIIQTVDDLNATFSVYMLMQVAISTGLLCLNGFQVIICKDSSAVIKFFLGLVIALIQLLFWCWYGNKFVSMADSLTNCQWFSGWENSYNGSLKNILTISMIQSLRPLEFHAIGLFKFTIPTFVDIIRKSYSVFILLKQTVTTD
ncbi:odorant receptor 83a-like isoform X2 [Microplitis mediator]|uniref:odorant receptor 83a-like isoform X2 n=1 Tax=Microplitis mediator TaxID=375433 RepID=UPI002552291E|nr:odorant receptor 83a-like isoform X2 [Microplitis mediator]